MIQSKSYSLKNNQILTNEILSSYIKRFWNEIFETLVSNNEVKHLMILCKVGYSDTEVENSNIFKTLGPLRRVEYKDLEMFTLFLTERLGILIDSYNPVSINKIVFTFVVREGKITKSDRLLLQDLSDKTIPSHEFNKIKLPISMNPSDYGTVKANTIINGLNRIIVTNNKRIFQFDILDNLINNVTILGGSDLKWTDTKLSEVSFKREIGKSTIYLFDGEIMLQKKELNAKSFRRLRRG